MKLFPLSEFSKNVLTLMTGTTISQAIPLAISPILTRIYTPEDFGIFALYMGVASLIAIVATGRYELAIMLPEKEDDALNLVALSVLVALCLSLFTLFIIYSFNEEITLLLGVSELSSWLYMIPVSVLLTGIYQSLNYWNNRKKQYKYLARSKIGQSVSSGMSNISLGSAGLGFIGLILSRIIGQMISIVVLFKYLKMDVLSKGIISKEKICILSKEYKRFPLLNALNAFVDTFRLSSINILIARFFSNHTLGQFSLAWQMVQVPISLLGSSFSQVFFQKVSQVNKNELEGVVKTFLWKASLLSLPAFVLIYVFAEDVFSIVFGEEWKLAGELASIMVPWIFLNFLSAPLSHVLLVLHRQDILLKVSIVYMLAPLATLILTRSLAFTEVLTYMAFVMGSVLIVYIILVLWYVKKENKYEV